MHIFSGKKRNFKVPRDFVKFICLVFRQCERANVPRNIEKAGLRRNVVFKKQD